MSKPPTTPKNWKLPQVTMILCRRTADKLSKEDKKALNDLAKILIKEAKKKKK